MATWQVQRATLDFSVSIPQVRTSNEETSALLKELKFEFYSESYSDAVFHNDPDMIILE